MDENHGAAFARPKYVPVIGPRLRRLLWVVFGLVAILGANSAYLGAITLMEWYSGKVYQNYFYQLMFLGHLVLGLILIPPVLVFGFIHLWQARKRPNRRAVAMGCALLATVMAVLFTGVALMRVGGFEIKVPSTRAAIYWAHILTPLAAVWLYVLHRLAGPRIRWKAGLGWAVVVAVSVVGMVFLHSKDPRKWNVVGPKDGEKYFHPSLARTASGNFIPARALMMDDYCRKCHPDAYAGWYHSAHHFSSFNNPPYLFSVKETRQVALQRDGNVKASRWCAGCHDVVPFFSGAFDDPNFDLEKHPTSQAGITCTACHAIVNVNSTRGNADYTIEEPIHYPFAYQSNAVLQYLNNLLVKAKPEFHKKTFLKPLHKTAEFCSVCHKVSLPVELTHYKDFLRGQNHYDSFLLSGVSGHGARSFYYPEKAQQNCSGCHMPLQPSSDFGAGYFSPTNNRLSIHNHLFPAANTGIAHLRGQPAIVAQHQEFLRGCVRIDIFGIKEGGKIDCQLIAPLRPKVPELKPGETYLVEVVLRNLKTGHHFTQGTADSNEAWVDAILHDSKSVIGRSGGLGAYGEVDPWSHFVNVYMLDRHGNRIDRRNPQDIFTPLYDHQIPPGSAQVVHYSFTVPKDQRQPLTFEVILKYRKFDTRYLQYVYGRDYSNDLPITTISSDKIVFPIAGSGIETTNPPSSIAELERWNDYGIALLLEGNKGSEKGELLQAEHAFANVESLGHPYGPLNLARVYLKEGRLDDAVSALQRAANLGSTPRWTMAWLGGLVDKQNGRLEQAARQFRSIIEDHYPELERRGFDFSKDYEVLNELGLTIFEQAKQHRLEQSVFRDRLLESAGWFHRTLELDKENLTAHYNLMLIYRELGQSDRAQVHQVNYNYLRPDDNARDRAVVAARRKNSAADHAAQALVIYPLQRPGAYGLKNQDTQPPENNTASTVPIP